MLHDHQIQCIGTGQQTNFKHCLKCAEINKPQKGKTIQFLGKERKGEGGTHTNKQTNKHAMDGLM
jgi:hypothetical protein